MQLLCGQCGHVQTADDDVAGPVECAHCGHAILIPGEFDPSATVTNVEPPADEDEGFAEIARKAVPRKVRLTCHECDKRFSVSARRSGRQGRCPACGTKIDVPYPDDEVQFDLPHVEHADFDLDEEPVELIAIEEPVLESAQRADDALVLPRDPVRRHNLTVEEQAAALAEAAAEAAVAPAPALASMSQEPPPKTTRQAKPVRPRKRKAAPAPVPPKAVHVPETVVPLEIADVEPQRAPSRRIYVLLAAGVLLAAAAGLILHTLGQRIGGDPIAITNDNKPPPPGNGPHTTTRTSRPATQPVTTTRPRPRTRPTTIDKPGRSTCKVARAELDVFAAQGYFPAPPGMSYLRAEVRLKAVRSPIDLSTDKQDVAVSFGDSVIPALGAPAATGLVPVLSQPVTVHLAPGQSRDMTFLFLVPSHLRRAELTIRNVPPAPFRPIRPSATPPATALAGTFIEKRPRNLRPLMKDPVIAAVQGARQQRLYVHRRTDTLQVYITPAGVRGVAKPIAPGLYETMLKRGSQERMCRLRLAKGGDTLIVYFADKPFHQMTYARVKR